MLKQLHSNRVDADYHMDLDIADAIALAERIFARGNERGGGQPIKKVAVQAFVMVSGVVGDRQTPTVADNVLGCADLERFRQFAGV